MTEPRIVIYGGPGTGKTTMAGELHEESGSPLMHTDALISMGWSEASAHVADVWLPAAGPWIIEGVAAGRALRKWLAATPDGLPCDVIIMLQVPRVPLNAGQERMAKGCATVWREIEPQLRARGVEIVVP